MGFTHSFRRTTCIQTRDVGLRLPSLVPHSSYENPQRKRRYKDFPIGKSVMPYDYLHIS